MPVVSTDAAQTAASLFFMPERSAWSPDEVRALVQTTLSRADDGELFLEYRDCETLSMEGGVLRHAGFNSASGFGLRAVLGEQTFFAQSNLLSMDALRRAAEGLGTPNDRQSAKTLFHSGNEGYDRQRYGIGHPLDGSDFAQRVALLSEIDAYGRGLDRRVVQVNATLHVEWQVVQVIRPESSLTDMAVPMVDIRPLVRLDISVVVEQDGRRERGYTGRGGRYVLLSLMAPSTWQAMTEEAVRQALVALDARPAPAGEMPVILGAGWPGILLHEAVGHGLEGDFIRKKTSVFTGRIGQRVAAPGVTVVDDATLTEQRGSLVMDDEGTAAGCTVLIEDGILKNHIHDRLNARLTGVAPTGNGRRESYAHAPMPRMTNTVMMPGEVTEDAMIRSTKKGLYAVNFGGGQVDITSGQFVFAASEAYLVEDGRVTMPVRGATLIGSGVEVMQNIEMIGSSMQLDPGIGTCGKAGQRVPVGVGQPILKLSGLTVGGIAS